MGSHMNLLLLIMIAEHRKISSTVITDGLVVAEKERDNSRNKWIYKALEYCRGRWLETE